MQDKFTDESQWQALAGYSRGRRQGPFIAVSGTTALEGGDTYAQTRECLQRGIAAVEALGGSVESILRTRMFLTPEGDAMAASRAHQELLGATAPANTLITIHSLVGEGLLVEVEMDAIALERDR